MRDGDNYGNRLPTWAGGPFRQGYRGRPAPVGELTPGHVEIHLSPFLVFKAKSLCVHDRKIGD